MSPLVNFDIFSDGDLDDDFGSAIDVRDHAEGDIAAGSGGKLSSGTHVRPSQITHVGCNVAVQTNVALDHHDADCLVALGPIEATMLGLQWLAQQQLACIRECVATISEIGLDLGVSLSADPDANTASAVDSFIASCEVVDPSDLGPSSTALR